jgi:probable phosphomutase (TIGR03848 family)
MITMFFIRHGKTDWIGKKLAGQLPGISLNEEGRQEAERLAIGLESARLTAIYSSPLERARETADPVARRHALEVVSVDALQELDFGDWTGKTFHELGGMEGWREILRHPSQTSFPGGESLREVQQRAVAWTDPILKREGELRIAVFSHADTIRLVLAHFAGMPIDSFQSLTVDPASISILQFEKNISRVMGVNWPASAAREAASL